MLDPRCSFHSLYAFLIAFLLSSWACGATEEVMLDTDLGPLSGTLTVPESSPPRALVLFISGSGPTDRNGNIMGLPGQNNSLKYLSDALLSKGYATLRFDKRLIGKSTSRQMSENDLRIETYIKDVKLWISYAEEQLDVPIYILGHSEGALIGMVAAQETDVAGFISLAGPGRKASELILSQVRPQFPSALFAQTQYIVGEFLAGRTVASLPKGLAMMFRESVQPYLISWFKYDPAEELAKLEIPALLIYGDTDVQVPTSDGALLQAAKPSAEFSVIAGMNHVLKSVDKGNMKAQIASYSEAGLPLADGLVERILVFLRADLK